MFNLPVQQTIAKMTASELIAKAEIIKTRSNDYFIRVGDLELNLNDEYNLTVSDYGIGIGVMLLADSERNKMIAMQAKIEEKYQRDFSA